MSLRTIPRKAVGGYIKLLRLPLDTALRLTGRSGANGGGIAVDRAEAAARDVAGAALGDEELRRDASRRRKAADAREEASVLETEAERHAQTADEQRRRGQRRAQQQRRRAAREAEAKKESAEKRRQARKRGAAQAESTRKSATRKAAAKVEEAIEDQERGARLEQLDEEAKALDKRGEALTAADEAQRLRDAASRAKAERKQD